MMLEANEEVVAAVAGKLETRADASRHNGEFAQIVSGINRTLDAVIGPLSLTLRRTMLRGAARLLVIGYHLKLDGILS